MNRKKIEDLFDSNERPPKTEEQRASYGSIRRADRERVRQSRHWSALSKNKKLARYRDFFIKFPQEEITQENIEKYLDKNPNIKLALLEEQVRSIHLTLRQVTLRQVEKGLLGLDAIVKIQQTLSSYSGWSITMLKAARTSLRKQDAL